MFSVIIRNNNLKNDSPKSQIALRHKILHCFHVFEAMQNIAGNNYGENNVTSALPFKMMSVVDYGDYSRMKQSRTEQNRTDAERTEDSHPV